MPKRILVIDDEELIVKSLAKLLEKNGFTVFVAKNGQDGLTMAEEEEFDLIVADIRMPGMTGVEAIQEIYRNLDSKHHKRIPVIFITGYADEHAEQKARVLEPVVYMYKPFEIKDLLDKVKEVLK